MAGNASDTRIMEVRFFSFQPVHNSKSEMILLLKLNLDNLIIYPPLVLAASMSAFQAEGESSNLLRWSTIFSYDVIGSMRDC